MNFFGFFDSPPPPQQLPNQGYQNDYSYQNMLQNNFANDKFFMYNQPQPVRTDDIWNIQRQPTSHQFNYNQPAPSQHFYPDASPPYVQQPTPYHPSNQPLFNQNQDPSYNQQFNNYNQPPNQQFNAYNNINYTPSHPSSNLGQNYQQPEPDVFFNFSDNQTHQNTPNAQNQYLAPPNANRPPAIMSASFINIINKKRQKKRDQDFYASIIDGSNRHFDAQYEYKYKDGYLKDQDDLLKQFQKQNNLKVSDSFLKIKDQASKKDDFFENVPLPAIMKKDSHGMNNAIKNSTVDFLLNIDNLNKFFYESGVFGHVAPAPMKEEPNVPNTANVPPVLKNSFINTFQEAQNWNKLDDLQELLTNSKAIAKARTQLVNGKYSDPLFPPDVKSILGFGEGKRKAQEYSQYPWLRPEQYFKGSKYYVFDGISSGDIEQGSLGDCYFLASLSAVAEFSERVERLFLTKEVSPQAIYAVALCIDGIWNEIVLDDQVPCQPVSKSILFNRSKQNELWVMLIEKAYAKVNGGYQNIEAGLSREALRTLTGASCKSFFTCQNREDIWKNIKIADEMNFIMTASSNDLDNGSDAYQEKIGICGSHAYSLMGAHEIEKVNGRWQYVEVGSRPVGQVERLVQLRNPWGKGEWKGEWGDQDKQWNQQLRDKIRQYNDSEDGIFCMTYNDFCKYFNDLQICYYHNNYKYSAVKVRGNKGETAYLAFKVTKRGVFYLSLNQKLTRAFPKREKYAYSNLNLNVIQMTPNGQAKILGHQLKDDFENWIELKLEPSEYFVEINLNWQSCVNECSFSIYGPEMCGIAILSPAQLPKGIHSKSIEGLVNDNDKAQKFNFGNLGFPDISYSIWDNNAGLGYVHFENKSKDTVLKAGVNFDGSQGLVLQAPFSGLRASVALKPGQSQSIVYNATKFPYVKQQKITASFEKTKENQVFYERMNQSNVVLKLPGDSGSQSGAKVKIMRHQTGIGFLYTNENTDKILNDTILFDLKNCHIDGVSGNVLSVVVYPLQEQMFQILADGPGEFSANVLNVETKTFPVQ